MAAAAAAVFAFTAGASVWTADAFISVFLGSVDVICGNSENNRKNQYDDYIFHVRPLLSLSSVFNYLPSAYSF